MLNKKIVQLTAIAITLFALSATQASRFGGGDDGFNGDGPAKIWTYICKFHHIEFERHVQDLNGNFFNPNPCPIESDNVVSHLSASQEYRASLQHSAAYPIISKHDDDDPDCVYTVEIVR